MYICFVYFCKLMHPEQAVICFCLYPYTKDACNPVKKKDILVKYATHFQA